jgi:hypothetical protein
MLISEIAEELEKESHGTFEDRADEKDEVNESLLFEGGIQDQEAKKQPIVRKVIDYKYMDGLRGIGAFAVYLHHFFWELMPM